VKDLVKERRASAAAPASPAVEEEREAEPATADEEAPGDDPEAEVRPPRPRRDPSSALREIRDTEERSLQEWLSTLGTHGAFKIQLRRDDPQKVTVRGKILNAAGFLGSFEHPIDEEWIQERYGGGTYALKATFRNQEGSYIYKKGFHRTVKIAGEPNADTLPGQVSPEPAGGESPTIVREAFSAMKDLLDQKGGAKGLDPTIQLMFEKMREDNDRRDRDLQRRDAELATLRRELSETRATPTPQDPIRDKMLNSLLDGQSGHVEALKLRHESELRQTKQAAIDDLKRVEDRHDRSMTELRMLHETTLGNLRSSHDRELLALRTAHETALKAEQSTYNIQAHTLGAENKRLEQAIAELKAKISEMATEMRELRAKKDKSLVEQAKEIREVRDALSDGETQDKSAGDKILDLITNPASLEFVQGIMTKRAEPAKQAAPQAQGPQHVRNGRGEVFRKQPDGTLVPLKPKPQPKPPIVTEDGTQIAPPEIEPAVIVQVVAYLERAFSANQAPEIVAQSGRTVVPEEIMTWIRNNHTEAVSGVDLFMSKVAKLPGTSPLSSQRGRNWLRMVGAALVGD